MIIEECELSVVRKLCEKHHGYGSCGGTSTHSYCVIEGGNPVAAFSWLPPAPGSAKSVCPEHPSGVLALSRMVAVPKSERELKHISKPLMIQMKKLIDRTRWPVLVTYSDEGQGHTGYVYQCSGWEMRGRRKSEVYESESGERKSSYSSGSRKVGGLIKRPSTFITRWEHWICERGDALNYSTSFGWAKVATGKRWKSGNEAFTWMRT